MASKDGGGSSSNLAEKEDKLQMLEEVKGLKKCAAQLEQKLIILMKIQGNNLGRQKAICNSIDGLRVKFFGHYSQLAQLISKQKDKPVEIMDDIEKLPASFKNYKAHMKRHLDWCDAAIPLLSMLANQEIACQKKRKSPSGDLKGKSKVLRIGWKEPVKHGKSPKSTATPKDSRKPQESATEDTAK